MHREHDGAESSSAHPQALARDLSTLSIEDPDAIRSKGIPSGRPSSGDTSKSDDTKSGPSAEKISVKVFAEDIFYRRYKDEDDIPVIMALIAPYLSEPYSVYCYRYFLHGWPQLCVLAYHQETPVGVIVCKQEPHRGLNRGYIAMLATEPAYRKLGIATTLVQKAIALMKEEGAHEIALEAEVTNPGALRLYESLGFLRTKRLYRFYLNASDAFRLILPIPEEEWKARPPDETGNALRAGLEQDEDTDEEGTMYL